MQAPAAWAYTQNQTKREVYVAFLFGKQDGRCAICGLDLVKGRMAIDHCHRTNYVRGLLCRECNLGLGLFKDDARNLRRAAEYLDVSAESLIMLLNELNSQEQASCPESDGPLPTE